MNTNRSLLIYIFIMSIIVTLDQTLKRWALVSLQGGNDLQITSWFNFSLATNRGVSWSFLALQSSQGFFILTAVITLVIIGFASYSVIQHLNRSKIYFESMVIGGALSNVIDRINHGYVIDCIDLHLNTWHWATFNIADAFIVVGVCGMLFNTIYKK
jgi:signal peptidase II